MWFNNTLIYHYELDQPEILESWFEEERLKPCPPHARFIYGWLPPFKDNYTHECMGATLICFGKEERVLPRNVVQREVEERANLLETQRGYPVKRAERAQLAEDIEFELLPKSFCVQKRLFALLDHRKKRLIINTSSVNQSEPLIASLRKTIPGIQLDPISPAEALAPRFVQWITQPASLPAHIQLGSNCVLFSPDDEKKRFHCKGYELPANEIQTLLSQGLIAAEITLIWHERIQLTLTQDLTLKQLKCLDYLADDFQEIHRMGETEQQDAAISLLAGELSALCEDLILPLSDHETVHQTTSTLCEA